MFTATTQSAVAVDTATVSEAAPKGACAVYLFYKGSFCPTIIVFNAQIAAGAGLS